MTTKKKFLGIIMASVLALGSLGLVACGDEKVAVTNEVTAEEWKSATTNLTDNLKLDENFEGLSEGIGITFTITQKDFTRDAENPTIYTITAEEKVQGKSVYTKLDTKMSNPNGEGDLITVFKSEMFYTYGNDSLTAYMLADDLTYLMGITEIPDTYKGKFISEQAPLSEANISISDELDIQSAVSGAFADMGDFTYDAESGCYKADLIECTHTEMRNNVEVTLYDKYTDVSVKFENGKLVSIKCKMETSMVQDGQNVKLYEHSVDMNISHGITITLPADDMTVSAEDFRNAMGY